MSFMLQLIFMDQIEDVISDYVMVKGEQCIVLKMKVERERDAKIVLTNPVSELNKLYFNHFFINCLCTIKFFKNLF